MSNMTDLFQQCSICLKGPLSSLTPTLQCCCHKHIEGRQNSMERPNLHCETASTMDEDCSKLRIKLLIGKDMV